MKKTEINLALLNDFYIKLIIQHKNHHDHHRYLYFVTFFINVYEVFF